MKLFIQRWWTIIWAWCVRSWTLIKPGPETRVGIYWAATLTAVMAALVGGFDLQSGFGRAADIGVAIVIAVFGGGLLALLIALLLTILRRLPKLLSGVVIAAAIFVSMVLPPSGFVFVPLAVLVGAALATLASGHFGRAHLSKKILTIVLGLAAFGAFVTLVVILAGDGADDDRVQLKGPVAADPPKLALANPAEPGPAKVKRLFYGNGVDHRRPEFNSQVAIKTPTVDGSLFFKKFKGWKEKVRHYYWGFGVDKLPLNARVWYPEGDGPFPLVLIVHGNHNMAEASDPGYEYLGELLASRGFILASIDENFLNGWIIELPKEQAARGWMLLEHLKLWKQWNSEAGNPFQGKVDLDNIALMGHSRGGEAVATAALYNTLAFDPDDANLAFSYGFHIKSIVAIAPVDGQYKPAGAPRTVRDVSYLTLQGSYDSDVSSFMGSYQFDRIKLENDQTFKAEVYAYRANHGQFNTVWGRSDAGEPLGRYLDLKPLLSGDEQRRISKTYISAFLEATLHGKRDYLPLFRDWRVGRDWLPSTLFINRFLDASYRPIANFNEDADVTSTTLGGGRISAENLSVWKEGRIPTRGGDRGYNGVFLGWNRENNNKTPVYNIALPAGVSTGSSRLTLSLAVTDEEAPEPGVTKPDDSKKKKDPVKDETTDFTVELETTSGVKTAHPLSQFGTFMPLLRSRFTKFEMLDDYVFEKAAEPIFQTFDLPLRAFGIDDASLVKTVRLRFDKTVSRVVILSQIGFQR